MSKLKITAKSLEEVRTAWRAFMTYVRAALVDTAALCVEDARQEACDDVQNGTYSAQSVQTWLAEREADVQAWQRENEALFTRKSQAAMRMLAKLAKQEFGPADLGYCYVADFCRNSVRCIANDAADAVAIGTQGVTYCCRYGTRTCSVTFDPPALQFDDPRE